VTNILDVTALFDVDGVAIDLNDPDAVANTATREVRRTTLAARLKGTYQSVDNIDAFTGMIAEQHVAGTEFGELQLATWTREFTKLRDGDRFFFGNDQGLTDIRNTYGIDFRKTLKEIVLANSDADSEEIETNAFVAPDTNFAAATCEIDYNFARVDGSNVFTGTIDIKNTSNQTINGWTLRFQWGHGQTLRTDQGINITQSGTNGKNVTATDVGGGGAILAPGEVEHTSFSANFDGVVNSRPPNFTLNNRRCTTPQQSNR
jgi:hypothetical protein